MLRACCILLLLMLGCDHPSPLGTFTRNDVSKWASDCDVPIVEENPHGPNRLGPLLRDGGPAFERATWRYRCPPPGWAVYTDSNRRIVGLCVDDEIQYPKYSEQEWQEVAAGKRPSTVRISELDRAQALITAHWGQKLAAQMLKGTSADHCSLRSEPVAPRMVRWNMGQFSYLDAPRIRSRNMCCWEVRE